MPPGKFTLQCEEVEVKVWKVKVRRQYSKDNKIRNIYTYA